jgi:hypothetical protein
MRLRIVASLCLVTCFLMVTSVIAQQPDPLTGTWTGDWGPSARDRNQVTVALKWDGKTLTGTVNPESTPIELQKSTFDPKTGTIHMEAMAPVRGETYHYIIDGKVDKGTMTGSWNHDNRKGDFKITKK